MAKKYPYRDVGSKFDVYFKQDMNANFDDIESDIKDNETRVNNILTGTEQPSEVVDARYDSVNDVTYTVLKDRLDNNATQLADIANSQIKGTDGKKYKIIACVLRNDGTGWDVINDPTHTPVNVLSVSNTTASITIDYGFTATKVVSLVAVPDETLAAYGFNFGSSVGTSSSNISVTRTSQMISGYIYYDGTSWQVSTTGTSGNVSVASFSTSSGILTINHDPIDYYYGHATIRDRESDIQVDLGSLGSTTSYLKFTNSAGTAITTPTTDMKVYFSRICPSHTIDPNTVDTTKFPNSNIWVYGIMEIA